MNDYERQRAVEMAGVILGPVCVEGSWPRSCDSSRSGGRCDVCGFRDGPRSV